MRADIAVLKAFYESQLGEIAARQIARKVAEIWPDLNGQRVVGVGYAPPVLAPIAAEASPERTLALMPGEQGAWAWPADGDCRAALVRDADLPLADRSADRVILLHALEDAAEPGPFLREIWRVLTDSGRLLVIAANRRGLWCRADAAPFGYGRPYSIGQLTRTLEGAMFAVEQEAHALYAPPSRRALALWSADAAERFGRRWLTAFGGVVIADASKSLYGAALKPGAARTAGVIADAPAGGRRAKTHGEEA